MGNFFYDLCNQEWQAVEVSGEGCALITDSPVKFIRGKNTGEQIVPDFTSKADDLPNLLEKHFKTLDKEQKNLFAVYIVSCFIPQIPHPILVLHGEKGSSKSTTMRLLKKIVDPARQDLLSLPTSRQELAIILNNNFMPVFDNLDALSQEKSDLLCLASTGGTFSKRTLYSDAEETLLELKRCVAINGINVVATQPDLLDRTIIFELKRIGESNRKTEKEIWESFERDQALIMGSIFNALSAAITLRPKIKLSKVGRMADFAYWGCAIAKAIGISSRDFIEEYLLNQSIANETAIESHPVASAVMLLMADSKEWTGSITELLKEIDGIALQGGIDTTEKKWPRDANVLSRRLNEIKSNLGIVGISYEHRHAGNYKRATFKHTDPNWTAPKKTHLEKLKRKRNESLDDL